MTGTEIYTDFFELKARPFALSADPEALFEAPQYAIAMNVLDYGLSVSAPILLLTGEVGTGKTTVIKALMRTPRAGLSVGMLSMAVPAEGALLPWVLNAFDVPIPEPATPVALFQRFQDFLLAEYAAGRRVVLIVDEAQTLPVRALEELRMLTNINSKQDELFQLFLVGQPELRDTISAPHMRQLAQRIAASAHLEALDAPTTHAYIAHLLTYAGGTGGEITDEAIDLIQVTSGGIPRLINQLCDLSMVYAWSDERKPVTREDVACVLEGGMFFNASAPSTPLLKTQKKGRSA